MKMNKLALRYAAVVLLTSALPAQDPIPDNPLRTGAGQTKATRINEAIYQAIGFGNAMMVVTSEGNAIIDTSIAGQAERSRKLLHQYRDAIRYVHDAVVAGMNVF